MTMKAEKTSKLEELPVKENYDSLRATLQRNQDQMWNRMNNIEDRLNKMENKGE